MRYLAMAEVCQYTIAVKIHIQTCSLVTKFDDDNLLQIIVLKIY